MAARAREPEPEYSFNGPLDLVPQDTPTYAYRVIEWWRSCWKRRESAIESLMEVQRKIDEAQPWKVWPENDPVGERDRFYREVLGVPLADVENEVIRLRNNGRPNKKNYDNVIVKSPREQGNSREYLLARLRRDSAKDHDGNYDAFKRGLLDAIERGELSVRQAALQAGYVKPTLTIPRNPLQAAATIRRHFTPEQIDELIAALEGEA